MCRSRMIRSGRAIGIWPMTSRGSVSVVTWRQPEVVSSRSSMRTLAGSSSMTRIRAAPRTSPTATTLAGL